MTGISQFSPFQVLEAARRAEAEGRWEYAVQFYRHVVAQHFGTVEAYEAIGALKRLEPHAHDAQLPPNSQRPLAPLLAPVGSPTTQPSMDRHRRGSAPLRKRPGLLHPLGRAALRQHGKRYRLGRLMAALMGIIGYVAAAAGVVALGANAVLFVTQAPHSLVLKLATSPGLATVLLLAASVLILLGQMAQATFDVAMRASFDRDAAGREQFSDRGHDTDDSA